MTGARSFLTILFLLMPLPAWAGDIIGEVISLSGEVTVRDDKARRFLASVGMPVEAGQMVRTGKSGQVQIRLSDGAIFRIAARSSFIIDRFLLSGSDERSMTARVQDGAMQYVSMPASFRKDDRKIFLANAAAAIRGTSVIAFVGPQIEAVLISGRVDIGARSNRVTLDRRGRAVFLSRTGLFDKAFIMPDEQLVALGDRLGWKIELPPPPEEGGTPGVRPITCTLAGGYLYCG